jgi:glycosyltransferase involved in cell wall biosynthesis
MTDETPLRVALLSYRGKPHCGGQGVYVRHLSSALIKLGHHVEVYGGQPYPEIDDDIELHKLRSLDIYNEQHPMRFPALFELDDWTDVAETLSFCVGNFPEPMAFSLRAARALRQRTGDFDLIHDNQTLGWGLLDIQKNFPVLSTIHHPITVDRRLEIDHARTLWERIGKRRWYAFTRMQTQVAKRMVRVLTVSENSKADISADHQVPIERIHVVPVGVDIDFFRPMDNIARIPGRLITTASADVALKGLRYLLEAVAKLRTERDIELVIIGKPKDNSHASNTLRELGLSDCVSFVSGVSDQRIVDLYSESELAVVPSLYEGFSLPSIEAMSCGVPLVATTGGALPEVTGADNETCFSVIPGDSEALARRIASALDDPEARARIGAAGRKRVTQRWSWRHTAESTVEQYRALLDERDGS